VIFIATSFIAGFCSTAGGGGIYIQLCVGLAVFSLSLAEFLLEPSFLFERALIVGYILCAVDCIIGHCFALLCLFVRQSVQQVLLFEFRAVVESGKCCLSVLLANLSARIRAV